MSPALGADTKHVPNMYFLTECSKISVIRSLIRGSGISVYRPVFRSILVIHSFRVMGGDTCPNSP